MKASIVSSTTVSTEQAQGVTVGVFVSKFCCFECPFVCSKFHF